MEEKKCIYKKKKEICKSISKFLCQAEAVAHFTETTRWIPRTEDRVRDQMQLHFGDVQTIYRTCRSRERWVRTHRAVQSLTSGMHSIKCALIERDRLRLCLHKWFRGGAHGGIG